MKRTMTPLPGFDDALSLPAPRRRWTREQCAPLEAAGLFERERLELVDGELIGRRGKARAQVKAFTWMHLWLLEAFGQSFVNATAPIDVNSADNLWSEPEPDLIVLKRDFTSFDSNPQPEDLGLVVEIADSSLKFDLTVKAAMYARAGIADYWVLDVAGRRLIVHREPAGGEYRSVAVYGEQEFAAPLSAPEARFRVGDAFGPPGAPGQALRNH